MSVRNSKPQPFVWYIARARLQTSLFLKVMFQIAWAYSSIFHRCFSTKFISYYETEKECERKCLLDFNDCVTKKQQREKEWIAGKPKWNIEKPKNSRKNCANFCRWVLGSRDTHFCESPLTLAMGLFIQWADAVSIWWVLQLQHVHNAQSVLRWIEFYLNALKWNFDQKITRKVNKHKYK